MINDLISLIPSDERLQFERYLKSRNRRNDVRNVDLFRALINGSEAKLKSEMGANAYHVLRNRMKHRLIDFIAQSTLQTERSGEYELTKTFVTAKRLLKQSKVESAFKLLLEVENDAREMENFTLEGEVQQLLIEHAHLPEAPRLEDVYERSVKNYSRQQSQNQLNLAYSRIRLAYQAVEFNREEIDLEALITSTFAEFAVSNEIAYSFSSLHQLVQLADIHGASSKKYHSVNLFFVEKLRQLQGGKSDTEQNWHYHIDILYAIAHIYFRKKDFETSCVFLDEMKEKLLRFNTKAPVNYELKYTMLMSLNKNHLGENKIARSLIDSILNEGISPDETIQIRLVLAMLQMQHSELRDCQRTLSKFTHSDAWYERQVGVEWTLHKLTLEILLHIDLENYEFADSRLKSLLRKYIHFLSKEDTSQARPFLMLVQAIIREPSVAQSASFHQKVADSIEWKSSEEEDVYRINFYAWLKAKMNRKEIYPTLLELLNTSPPI